MQPLVCLEGLASGLGLVITEPSAQSLDTSKPWISVIPDSELENIDYLNYVIKENSKVSSTYRKEIVEYSKNFDWSNIIKKYLEIIND